MAKKFQGLGVLCLAFAVAPLAACKSKQDPPPAATHAPAPPPPPVVESPATTARELFHKRCVLCHGESGHGDGPGGAALTPKPRVFTDAAWQASVTDDKISEIIVKGGAGVGKSPGMPSNPDLEHKPEVVSELVKLVRGFRS